MLECLIKALFTAMNLTGMLSTRHVQSIQSRNLAKFNIVCIWTRSVPMDLSRYTLESWVVHKLIHVVRLIKSHSAVHLRIGTTLQVRLSQSAMMRACLTMSSRKMKLTSPTTWRKFNMSKFRTNVYDKCSVRYQLIQTGDLNKNSD